MTLSARTAQSQLEELLHDAILYALGRRLPSVDSIAALRAMATRGAAGSSRSADDLIVVMATGAYRWSPADSRDDDGQDVILPDDVPSGEAGRWNRWESPLRFAPTAGGNSATLDQIESGPLSRVLLLDKSMALDDINVLLSGEIPAVVIVAAGDDPVDATLNSGWLWLTDYHFEVGVLTRDYRGEREAATATSEDATGGPGANALDGAIKELLAGSQLAQVIDAIREVRLGAGRNLISDSGQRRVMRTREYTIRVSETHAQAPNETAPVESATLQANLAELNRDVPFEGDYVASGLAVAAGVGLVRMVGAGTAIVGGDSVSYAGELHTFPAGSDVYRDLLPNGSLVFVAVSAGVDEPPVTATALRVAITRTDGSGITSDRFLASVVTPYGPAYDLPLEFS